MSSPTGRRLGLLALAALAGVVLALVAHYGSLGQHLPPQAFLLISLSLVFAVLGALAYVSWRVEPAWLLTAGLLASAFNGNWAVLGFPGGLAPDRLLLFAGIGAILVRSPPAQRLPRLRLEPVHVLLAAVFAWAVGSALAAGTLSHSSTLFVLLDRFAVPFAVFTLVPVAFYAPRHRAGLLAALVGFGAYLGLTAIFESVGPQALVFPKYILDPAYGYHAARARGPFVEATANGIGLYVSAVAAAVALATWKGRRPRWFAGFVFLACALGLLLTLTRSVWVASIVATAVTLVVIPSLRRFLFPGAIGLSVMVLLALALVPGLSSSAQNRKDSDRPVWERENVDAAAVNMVSRRPLFGYGLGTFNEVNGEYFKLLDHVPQVALLGLAIHNVFLALAVELGLIGAGLFVAALLCVVGRALFSRGPPELAPWRAGMLAIAIFWTVVANFAPTGQAFPSMIVWFWAGIVLSGAVKVGAPVRRAAPAPVRLAYGSGE
jgi:O-antigen ligase